MERVSLGRKLHRPVTLVYFESLPIKSPRATAMSSFFPVMGKTRRQNNQTTTPGANPLLSKQRYDLNLSIIADSAPPSARKLTAGLLNEPSLTTHSHLNRLNVFKLRVNPSHRRNWDVSIRSRWKNRTATVCGLLTQKPQGQGRFHMLIFKKF